MDSNLKQTLTKFRKAYDERLKNGQVVPLLTKGIEPLSEESGTIQETPFIAQGTGTANNTSPVDTAPVGKQLEKQGNTICVNQWVQNGNFTDTSNWATPNVNTFSVSNNVATFLPSSAYSGLTSTSFTPIAGHTYIIVFETKLKNANSSYVLQESVAGTQYWTNITKNTSWNKYYIKRVVSTSGSRNLTFQATTTTDLDELYIRSVQLIDLTQWFNGDIPTDLLNSPSHWSWYQNYGDYIAYNTGTLVNCAGRYLVNTGRNQWDEEWKNGYYTLSGYVSNPNYFSSKNPIPVIQNTTYYMKAPVNFDVYGDTDGTGTNLVLLLNGNKNTTFSTSSNIKYIYFSSASTNYGNTYNHDITISLYYSTGDGYSEYYAYEQPKTYDTGVEVLRKAGNVKDTKAPDGTITRRIGSYTFTGNESWTNLASDIWYCDLSIQEKLESKVICSKLQGVSASDRTESTCWFATTQHRFYVQKSGISSSSDLQTFTNAMVIQFELATTTTEQGTPFAENIEINDYGTMYWFDTNNALVEIPQGTKLFYPADYVLYLDSLVKETNGNVGNLLSKTMTQAQFDSAMNSFGYYKQQDLSSGITDVAGLTYDIKRIYKIGNVCTLTIKATNSTGSAISSGTNLFTLPSGCYGSGALFGAGSLENATFTRVVVKNDGNVAISSNIPNTEAFYITFSYSIS